MSHDPVDQAAVQPVARAASPDAPEAREALVSLCRAYWYPLCAYFRRRTGDAEAALDLTQGLFADLLARNDFACLVDGTTGAWDQAGENADESVTLPPVATTSPARAATSPLAGPALMPTPMARGHASGVHPLRSPAVGWRAAGPDKP